MGKFQQQEERISDRLKEVGRLSNEQAMQLLGVSTSTIRRLFISLEAKGIAVRKFGGIQSLPDSKADYLYEKHEVLHTEEKLAIGTTAAQLVESGDTLYIDWGTTTSRMCMMLAKRLANNEIDNITVFTNSLINLDMLYKNCQVMFVGGVYRDSRKDFCGYLAEETLKNLSFKKCFVGCDGYSQSFGFSAMDFNTARINEIVFENSKKRYVLMDSSKYEATAIVGFSKGFSIDMLITDSMPPEGVCPHILSQVGEIKTCAPIELKLLRKTS